MNETPATAYLAKLPALPESAPLGENHEASLADIQLFPPGTHDVVVTNAKGQSVPLTITADSTAAETLETARAAYQAEAEAGTGDAPYLDFNHDDREASAWVKAIRWAGDDPITGGIRAQVELTADGRAAIEGKTFRRVSPAFHAQNGRITGAPANMGGFVNRAAFRTIAPLFAAKETPETNPPQATTTMTEEQIAALQAENAQLKTELETAKAELAKLTKADAEATVEAAAKDGRIGTAPELKAKWVDSLIRDPGAKDLLAALPANPALTPGTTLTAKQPETQPETRETLLAQFAELKTGEERDAFYAKHRETLIS